MTLHYCSTDPTVDLVSCAVSLHTPFAAGWAGRQSLLTRLDLLLPTKDSLILGRPPPSLTRPPDLRHTLPENVDANTLYVPKIS